jgi:hypothetical protein
VGILLLTAHDAVIKAKDQVVPIGKLDRRFYEAVALFRALHRACRQGRRLSALYSALDWDQRSVTSAEHHFQCFVNKLAQVCDSKRGGATVSSFAVTQTPDRIIYVFAANKGNASQLESTKSFVVSLLRLAASASLQSSQDKLTAHGTLLRKILQFNKGRVKTYLVCLVKNLGLCIEDCSRSGSEDGVYPFFFRLHLVA